MTGEAVPERAWASAWPPVEQRTQASIALRNTVQAMALAFSPRFSASC
jgi:hypothetical protein